MVPMLSVEAQREAECGMRTPIRVWDVDTMSTHLAPSYSEALGFFQALCVDWELEQRICEMKGVEDSYRGLSCKMEETTPEPGDNEAHITGLEAQTEEEEEYVEYEENEVAEGIQKCKYSVVGKLITTKEINPVWVQSAMGNIWRKPKGFNMVEIQPKLYQFFVERETDMKRILKGDPWMFRNAWLMVKKWERGINPTEMSSQVLI
ncbi:hypothetical protein PIB30_024431 [Stylosanthes scabra]|uniref:DUF4283 domain-containing protein n=1 Tax=Stylosanthes scabra TaxID=79078 RepID=A0ABU6V8R4_9FABA|nr:hypothetical protein [Stylosanthes scabra]